MSKNRCCPQKTVEHSDQIEQIDSKNNPNHQAEHQIEHQVQYQVQHQAEHKHQPAKITTGRYLAKRLVEAGVTHFFTVPGDYTLALLDELLEEPGLKMVDVVMRWQQVMLPMGSAEKEVEWAVLSVKKNIRIFFFSV